jgi:hypothetical protein
MIHFSRSFKLLQWRAIPFAVFGFVTASTLPFAVPPAQAQATDLAYGACADELIAAGITAEAAAIACSTAYRPTDVSSCVTGVLAAADVPALSALTACSRDRRPAEVSTCVADIHSDLVVGDSLAVVDLCHRTILPERYSACVIGIATEAGLTTEESLATCIAAGYRPLNVSPTYIPME